MSADGFRRPRSICDRYGLDTLANSANRRTDISARSRWVRMNAPTSSGSDVSIDPSSLSRSAGISERSGSEEALDRSLALAVTANQLCAQRIESLVAIAAIVGDAALERCQLLVEVAHL